MKTENLNEAELYLYNYLKGQGFTLRIGQIKDFRLDADEPKNFIEGYAADFMGEYNEDSNTDYSPSLA